MISVCAKLRAMTDDDDHIDGKRVMELAREMGYDSVRQVEMAVQASTNNLQKYFDGVSKPRANVLLRMTELLNAPPSYLYGRPVEMVKKNVLEMVRKMLGHDEANILEIYLDMTPEQKKTILQMLGSFAKHEAPTSAFERDARVAAAKPARAVAGSKKK